MVGLLSLPDEVVELVGKHVIKRHDGLKAWCRLTSTCKRLWGAQLPGSAYSWSIKPDVDIEGKSKASALSLALCKVPLSLSLASPRRCALAITADTINAVTVGVSMGFFGAFTKGAAFGSATPDCKGPPQSNTELPKSYDPGGPLFTPLVCLVSYSICIIL